MGAIKARSTYKDAKILSRTIHPQGAPMKISTSYAAATGTMAWLIVILGLTACSDSNENCTSAKDATVCAKCGDAGAKDGANTLALDGGVQPLASKTLVGKLLYFDPNLSDPPGQSCASCHSPEGGFADPDRDVPVSRGVKSWLVGNRNSPSAAYASFSPEFHYDEQEKLYVGGQFWDGRAKNLIEQAKGPFLNPLEMNNKKEADVVEKVKNSEYAVLFLQVFGQDAFTDTAKAYHAIAEAIAAFESSNEVNRFSSKYDYYLKKGASVFTDAEKRGLDLFNNKGKCAECHPSEKSKDGKSPLFTDFTYDNLGTPRNSQNPFYKLAKEFNPDGENFVDLGLGGFLKKAEENGKMKVPTLRNIELTAPYMHNGVFTTLKEVVDFYNTRDVDQKWGPPEVNANVNKEELGNLGLSAQEVEDLVAFLKTLTDGYVYNE
jgi:cytochrome c peroxidase